MIKKNRAYYEKFLLDVEIRSATELVKHAEGPGKRFVFADHKNNPSGKLYAIIRTVKNVKAPKPHVEGHTHPVDSMWIFEGDEADLTGLEAEVSLDEHSFRVSSPASVYVPAGVRHSYRFISGSGRFINLVLTDGKSYNEVTL